MADEAAVECAARAFCHNEPAEMTDPYWHGEMRLVIDALVSEGHMVPASSADNIREGMRRRVLWQQDEANRLEARAEAVEAKLALALDPNNVVQMSWHGGLVKVNSAGMREVIDACAAAEAELVVLREQLATAVELLRDYDGIPSATAGYESIRRVHAFLADYQEGN